ncbi:FUSC family protein [Microbacterium sp. MC2]
MRMTDAVRSPQRSPLLQIVKSAAATIAAWLLGGVLVPGTPPVFAAIAALLVVQPSVTQSFGKGIERTVGVITGVAIASAIGLALGEGSWAIALAVVAALITAWALKMTPGTANQVAISALLVLALGVSTPGYASARVLETLIGAVIGFVVNVLVVPPVSVGPARRAMEELGAELADALDRLGDAFDAPRSPGELTALLRRARAVRPARDAAESAIVAARESLSLNPRGRAHRSELARLDDLLERFSPIVTQMIGMTRTFTDRYDDALASEPTVRAIAEQLHRAAHDVRLAVRSDTASADAADLQPALTRPLSVSTPSSGHWILIGSLLIDLLRIHTALAQADPVE